MLTIWSCKLDFLDSVGYVMNWQSNAKLLDDCSIGLFNVSSYLEKLKEFVVVPLVELKHNVLGQIDQTFRHFICIVLCRLTNRLSYKHLHLKTTIVFINHKFWLIPLRYPLSFTHRAVILMTRRWLVGAPRSWDP